LPRPNVGVENEADSLQILVRRIIVHYATSQYTRRPYMASLTCERERQIYKFHRSSYESALESVVELRSFLTSALYDGK
jgi:hypothetical protein